MTQEITRHMLEAVRDAGGEIDSSRLYDLYCNQSSPEAWSPVLEAAELLDELAEQGLLEHDAHQHKAIDLEDPELRVEGKTRLTQKGREALT